MPCVCTTVKKLSRTLGRTYDAALTESGVSNTQLAVLRAISRQDGMPLVRVAEDLEMDRTSLYRAIAPMVRDGWVEVAGGEDARSRAARLTAKGSELLEAATKSWRAVQEHVVGKFGKKAYRSLLADLERLAACTGMFEK